MLFTKKNRLYIRYDHEISNEKLRGGQSSFARGSYWNLGPWPSSPHVATPQIYTILASMLSSVN